MNHLPTVSKTAITTNMCVYCYFAIFLFYKKNCLFLMSFSESYFKHSIVQSKLCLGCNLVNLTYS